MNVSAPVAPSDAAPAPIPAPAQRTPAHLATALRALIWKDFRRAFPLVLVILAIFALLATIPYIVHLLDPQAAGGPNKRNILAREPFLAILPFLTAFVGIGLGLALARETAASDRWALLMHRPLSRPRIFLGRLIAALFLYGLAAGIPAGVLMLYAATSFDLPFDWAMTLPVLADVAGGFLCLLAGMVLVERRAFIAVRFLPAVAAVLASAIALHVPTFGAALLATVIAGIVFALAAMGSHITDGGTLRAPAPARAAITLILLAGISAVLVIAGTMAKSLIQDHFRDTALNLLVLRPTQIGTTFCFLPDGTVGRDVVRVGDRLDKPAGIQIDPSGVQYPRYLPLDSDTPPNPLITGRIMDQLKADSTLLNYTNFQNSYRDDPPRGIPAPVSPPGAQYELWYVIPAEGVLRGYDATTHQLLGTMGVDGFAPPGKSAQGFTYAGPGSLGLFIAPRGVYHVDLKNRTSRLAYELPAGMTVHGIGDIAASRPSDGAGNFLVLTEDRVLIYAASRYNFPADATAPLPVTTTLMLDHKAAHIEVTRFDPSDSRAGRWGIAYSQAAFNSQNNGDWDTLYNPQTFDLFNAAGTRIEHHQFAKGAISVPPPPPESPRLSAIRHEFFLVTGLVDAATNLAGIEIVHRIFRPDQIADDDTMALLSEDSLSPNTNPWYAVPAVVVLVLCAAGMAGLARRYGAPLGIVWTAVALVLGPAVLLAFICTHPRPPRESCPSCGKMHPVIASRCPRCGAESPLPVFFGIEIF